MQIQRAIFLLHFAPNKCLQSESSLHFVVGFNLLFISFGDNVELGIGEDKTVRSSIKKKIITILVKFKRLVIIKVISLFLYC